MNKVYKYFVLVIYFKCIRNVNIYFNIPLFHHFYHVCIDNIFNDLISIFISSQQFTSNIICYHKCADSMLDTKTSNIGKV